MAVQIARWMVFEKRTLKLEKQEACAIRQPRKMESSNAAIVLARSGRQRFMSPIFHFMKLYVVCAISADEAAFAFPMFLPLSLSFSLIQCASPLRCPNFRAALPFLSL